MRTQRLLWQALHEIKTYFLVPPPLIRMVRIISSNSLSLGLDGSGKGSCFVMLNSGWRSTATRNIEKHGKQRGLHLSA